MKIIFEFLHDYMTEIEIHEGYGSLEMINTMLLSITPKKVSHLRTLHLAGQITYLFSDSHQKLYVKISKGFSFVTEVSETYDFDQYIDEFNQIFDVFSYYMVINNGFNPKNNKNTEKCMISGLPF
jgi:hypothetical protein